MGPARSGPKCSRQNQALDSLQGVALCAARTSRIFWCKFEFLSRLRARRPGKHRSKSRHSYIFSFLSPTTVARDREQHRDGHVRLPEQWAVAHRPDSSGNEGTSGAPFVSAAVAGPAQRQVRYMWGYRVAFTKITRLPGFRKGYPSIRMTQQLLTRILLFFKPTPKGQMRLQTRHRTQE